MKASTGQHHDNVTIFLQLPKFNAFSFLCITISLLYNPTKWNKDLQKGEFDSYLKNDITVTKPTLESNLDLNNVAPIDLVLY